MTSHGNTDVSALPDAEPSSDACPGQHRLGSRRLLVLIPLAALSLLALYLRVGAVLGTEVDHPLRFDAGQYFQYAYNLRHHGVYSMAEVDGSDRDMNPQPDAYRSPGYPVFLTLFVDGPATDRMLLRILLAQAVLSTVAVGLTYLLALRFLPPLLAFLAGLHRRRRKRWTQAT